MATESSQAKLCREEHEEEDKDDEEEGWKKRSVEVAIIWTVMWRPSLFWRNRTETKLAYQQEGQRQLSSHAFGITLSTSELSHGAS